MTPHGLAGRLTITRLGAFLGAVTELVAVAALEVGHVPGFGTILGHVAFLATVTATTRACLGAVLGEVTN